MSHCVSHFLGELCAGFYYLTDAAKAGVKQLVFHVGEGGHAVIVVVVGLLSQVLVRNRGLWQPKH